MTIILLLAILAMVCLVGWRTNKQLKRVITMATTAQDVLREVSETTASNAGLTNKILELLQKPAEEDGSIRLTADEATLVTESLQGVQDANAQTVEAINAVLTPPVVEG